MISKHGIPSKSKLYFGLCAKLKREIEVILQKSELLVCGGVYTVDSLNVAGFALYIDECINQKMKSL